MSTYSVFRERMPHHLYELVRQIVSELVRAELRGQLAVGLDRIADALGIPYDDRFENLIWIAVLSRDVQVIAIRTPSGWDRALCATNNWKKIEKEGDVAWQL